MYDFSFLTTVDGWVTLITVSFLEIVLGIDNVIFIAIVTDKLPKANQTFARNLGLSLALIIRIILLFFIGWIVRLTNPLFFVGSWGATGRDLILLAGGVFLIYKTTIEIFHKVTHHHKEDEANPGGGSISLPSAIIQIVILDTVFSFDSILTAVGLCNNNVALMTVNVVIAMFVMISFSGPISNFVNKHPAIKTLALFFLVVIGAVLIIESLHFHFDKGYVYFALAFSLFVEFLNMRERANAPKE